jgi:hypothetical protein
MSIKTSNNKFNLINSRVKYGTDGGINVDQNALVVNPLNGRVGVNNLNPEYNLDICGNINVNGYLYYYGNNINTQFYPTLNSYSSGVKAVSTWTTRNIPDSCLWSSICWSPELTKFVVVPFNGTKVLNSPDGINWNSFDISNTYWSSVCWSPELRLFCAVAAFTSLPNNPRIMTSPDGITWTTRNSPSSNDFLSICWSSRLSLFVAVGYGNSVITSSDGINWNLQSCSNNNWESVTYSSDLRLFVAVASSGVNNRVMTSPDGINWTSRTSASDNSWTSITWSSELGLFVAVASSGVNNRVMTSPDGINWTSRTSASDNSWLSVTWSPQLRLFCAVSYDGINRVMTSPDGINWTLRTATSPNWQSICWSPELGIFCAVAYDGSPDLSRVMTSSLKGRPPTAYNMFDSSFNNINQLGLWNFQSVSRGVPVTKTTNFSVVPGENWIIVNNSSGTTTVTLPSASSYPGLEITMKTIQNQAVVSASSNVVPINSSTASTAILTGTAGSWATLVSDASTNWIITNS